MNSPALSEVTASLHAAGSASRVPCTAALQQPRIIKKFAVEEFTLSVFSIKKVGTSGSNNPSLIPLGNNQCNRTAVREK